MKKIFITLAIPILILLAITPNTFAANSTTIQPTDEQYLELRKVEVKDIVGQNKQVILELWGNNIEFKRI